MGFGLKIADVRQKTEDAKSNANAQFEQNREKASEEAFEKLIENAEEQVKEAMCEGRTRTYLLRWKYEEDPDKAVAFNGIKMLDILKSNILMERLNEYFNPDKDENGFRVNWHKFNNSNPSEYGIYVSWYVPQKKD